jgi:hypothetical protein
MYGQGHYYCASCGHAVYASRGGCGTCMTPLGSLLLLDVALDRGYVAPGIGFDPFDGEIAFDIPGTPFAIEPDGQLDADFGGFDIPL